MELSDPTPGSSTSFSRAISLPPDETFQIGSIDPAAAVLGPQSKPKPSAKASSSAFGVSLRECAMAVSYGCTVPAVLVHLWTTILSLPNGLQTEGIFRVSPDPRDLADAERELVARGFGAALTSFAPEVLAHLIKSFLRRLPAPNVLGSVPMKLIADCAQLNTAAACNAVLRATPRHERQLLEWLIRVIFETHKERHVNRMDLKNLAVIFAPNLWLQTIDETADLLEQIHNVERVERSLYNLCAMAERAASKTLPRGPAVAGDL